jgi:hypothetical protein
MTPFREIQLKALESTPIAVRPWRQVAFDRLTVFADEEMDFESIKIAVLAGNVPPLGLMLVSLGSWNPIIVTHRERETLKEIDGFRMEMVPQTTEQFKHGHDKVVETM